MGFFKVLFVCLISALLFGAGFYAGIVFQESMNDNYQNLAVMTCDYSNKLTDLVNNQSGTLEKCMGKPANDLERLNKLNCELLIKGG